MYQRVHETLLDIRPLLSRCKTGEQVGWLKEESPAFMPVECQ
jgi:hypothetical protein